MNRKLIPDFSKASPDEIKGYAEALSQLMNALNVHDITHELMDKAITGFVKIWNGTHSNLQVQYR